LQFIWTQENDEYPECRLVRSDASDKRVASILRVEKASHPLTLFLARGFFYPEDGGEMFLENIGSLKTHTAL
jgi:hypothetical protein